MKVLIVVDMQNDFIDGSLGTPEAQEIVPLVAETIEELASPDTVILFTRDTHPKNYMETLEGQNLPVPHCIENTQGWEINSEVWDAFYRNLWKYHGFDYLPTMCVNHIIDKPTFGSMDLQNILCHLNEAYFPLAKVDEIILMGLCTDICVLSNAILCKATLPEVPVSVVADCCAGVTPASHANALEAMKMCQINII